MKLKLKLMKLEFLEIIFMRSTTTNKLITDFGDEMVTTNASGARIKKMTCYP